MADAFEIANARARKRKADAPTGTAARYDVRLGTAGGKAKTKAKVLAARQNGRLGGRPKKVAHARKASTHDGPKGTRSD